MSKSTNLLVAFLLCMVLCVSPVSGKILKVPSEHPTIDVAIGIASDGDTILIARGTYEHTILNVNKRLTLASDYIDTKDQSDIDQTIIKATPAAEKQWFALNSKDSRIIGLTIIGNKNHTLKITSPYSEVLYCNFIGGGDQLSFEGGGGRVAHCHFDGAGDDAVDADNSVSYVVEYCTFDNVKTLLDYCLFFKSRTDYDSGIATGSNILTEDPNFKDTKTFELSQGSPAIDAGTAKYAEVLKIPDGAYNGSAPDLGAKELAKHP